MPALPFLEPDKREQALLIKMVRQVISDGVAHSRLILPDEPDVESLCQPAASFVTLFRDGELRGCIGTTKVTEPLWKDACRHGYSSAFEDHRFLPLNINELEHLSIEISILSPMVEMENRGEQKLLNELSPNIDGLMIKQGQQGALFLPAVWRSLAIPAEFLRALKKKAGWPDDYWSDDIRLFKFTTFTCK
mgnify:FL=1